MSNQNDLAVKWLLSIAQTFILVFHNLIWCVQGVNISYSAQLGFFLRFDMPEG